MKSNTSVITYRGAPIPFEFSFIGTQRYTFEITLEESGQILPVLRGMYFFPYPVQNEYAGLKTMLGKKISSYPISSSNIVLPTILSKPQKIYPIATSNYISPSAYCSNTPKYYPVSIVSAPPTPSPTEPYYNYVSTLLKGSGTNDSTNNSIVDSSTYSNIVYKYGSTTQGSFSPYSTALGYWSVYFPSEGGYLSVNPNCTDFRTDDFTIEAWINLSVLNNSVDTLLANYDDANVTGIRILVNSGSNGGIQVYAGNTLVLDEPEGISNSDVWNHIAVVRSSGITTLYVNGYDVTSNIDTNDYRIDNSKTTIGASFVGGTYSRFFCGYISNLRIVRGTAVYVSNFIPSDRPISAIAGTTLLICQNNKYNDASVNNYAIVTTGKVAVSSVSAYLPPFIYSSQKYGGSISFRNEFNFLYNFTPNSLNVFNSDFTIEGWFYFTAGDVVETQAIYTNFTNPTAEGAVFFGKSEDTAGRVSFFAGDYDIYNPLLTDTDLPPNNAWTHYAVVRAGNNFTLYRNGISVSTATFMSPISESPGPIFIATHGMDPGFYLFKGYITDFRIVNGSAVYTSNFTPPNSPLQPIQNTRLLLNGRNAAIPDFSVKNDVETDGVSISTSISKWGTGSMYFDGLSKINVVASDGYNLSNGTWTIEGWFYIISAPSGSCSVVMIGSNSVASSYRGIVINSDLSIQSIAGASGSTGMTTVPSVIAIQTWNHIAVVMKNRLGSIYVNGALCAGPISSVTQMTNVSNTLCIGTDPSSAFNPKYYGYIQDLRITKGVARYNGNFTTPSQL